MSPNGIEQMNIRIVVALLVASFISPLKAQVIEVTATGIVTRSSGFDSSVEAGTPFTYYYVLDEADAPSPASGPGSAEYIDSSSPAIGTETFGDYTFSQSDYSGAYVYTDFANGYGYYLYSGPTSLTSYYETAGIILISTTTPSVAPDTSLSSIKQFPISDFNNQTPFNFSILDAQGFSQVSGEVTSYTLQIVPEPSECALLLFSGLFVFALRPFIPKSFS
jgi:hypothetical protein